MHNSQRLLLGAVTTAALTLPSLTARANEPVVRLVDWQAEGSQTGEEWEDAFTTLSGCLEYIAGVPEPPEAGWQIWVAQGTYIPSPEEQTFSIANKISIYGGFQGHETTRQQRNPETYETILSGEFYSNASNSVCGPPNCEPCEICGTPGNGSCFEEHGEPGCSWIPCCCAVCSVVLACCQTAWDEVCVETALSVPQCAVPPNAPHVVSATTLGLDRRIDGFTITRGGSFEPGQTQQIGIAGAGILISRGSLRVIRCTITDNRAERGGGIAIATTVDSELSADGQVWNCSILGNIATAYGAGIYVMGNATYTIANTEIAENWAIFQGDISYLGTGGGLWDAVTVDDNFRLVANCTIVRNMANGPAGIYQPTVVEPEPTIPFSEDLAVVNSIVRNNWKGWADPEGTVPAECDEPCESPDFFGQAELINCLVAFDELNPPSNFIDCINAPPGLVDIDGGDYRLDEGSPCIDAGDDGNVVVDSVDVNDNTNVEEVAPDRRLRKRVQPAPGQAVARVDIGAHEYPNCICSTGDFNEDNSVDGSDLGVLLGSWGPCSAPCPADLDGNGEVDGADLGILLGAWCGDRAYPRDCVEESSFMSGGSGGSGGSQSSQEQSSGLTLGELAALLGFADVASFAGWLGQLPFEEMEGWLSLLAD